MANLVRTMLESGVKLGVSSRGSGNVRESDGLVSDFEIVTVDVVAQPSAPDAYPVAVYESLMNMRYGHKLHALAGEVKHDQRAQQYLAKEIVKLINEMKIG